jgi:hypothetical protein
MNRIIIVPSQYVSKSKTVIRDLFYKYDFGIAFCEDYYFGY